MLFRSELRRVGILGADPRARRVAARLCAEMDAALVEGSEGVDLVVADVRAVTTVPDGGASWLLVGGR
mgnify:FL=1